VIGPIVGTRARDARVCYVLRVHLYSLLEQGVVALTASRRLAHAIRLGFAQHAQARGLTVWRTPQVLPWSTWLRQQRLVARAVQQRKFEGLLTATQARVLWDEIVARSHAGSALLMPSNAARLAARSWQLLHDYLIPLERLERVDTEESRALLEWCRAFERRCEVLGMIDDAKLAHWAFDAQFVPEERVVFAGFDMLVPAVQRLADRWRASGRVVDAEDTTTAGASVEVLAAPDAAAEIEQAAQWARSQLENGATSVGVIVGDLQSRRDEVQRIFEDVFAPGRRHTHAPDSDIPVVVAAPPALASYPLVDAALLVLRLATGEGDSALVGRILRSPFIVGAPAERSERALADQALREGQRDQWSWVALERWAALRRCNTLALAARGLVARLRGLPRQAMPSEWAEKFYGLLSSIGWPGDRTLTSVEHQVLEKFQDALAELGSLDPIAPRLTFSQALRRFENLLQETPFEPETTSASVVVIDAMTSAGMQFDALWVTGLQADRFPASVSPDPLIPLELQRAAGIPQASAEGLLRLAHAQLARWTASARRVVLSWPEREGDAELTMSPLLVQFARTEPRGERTPTFRELLFANRPELEVIVDDRAPPVTAASASGGAAILELQSRCPFKAYAELRLESTTLERVSIGVDPAQRGAILHEVLREIWAQLQTQEALLALSQTEIETRVRNAAQRWAMRILSPDTRVRERLASLEIESAVRQVMTLLALERRRPPFKVRFAETSERYSIGGLEITLRPDRIDELGEGGELLIDYKLGDKHRPTDWLERVPGRPRSPQLPLYGLAHGERLRALAFVVLAAGKVEYRGWSDGANVAPGVDAYPPRGVKVDLGDPLDWQSLQDQWRFTLTRLAEQFVAGEAAVDPFRNACDTCHLSTLCRVHELGTSERAEVEHD
jgi:ATP-dependent helicase/nuclease subunit B